LLGYYYAHYFNYAHHFVDSSTLDHIGPATISHWQMQGSFCSLFKFIATLFQRKRSNTHTGWASGIKTATFVVKPDFVWYSSVLLLFSACARTDTMLFDCAFVSTMKTYDNPERSVFHYFNFKFHYGHYCNHIHHFNELFSCKGWLDSVGSRILSELYVIPIQNIMILGKLSSLLAILGQFHTACA
jgi:hypothetical protein